MSNLNTFEDLMKPPGTHERFRIISQELFNHRRLGEDAKDTINDLIERLDDFGCLLSSGWNNSKDLYSTPDDKLQKWFDNRISNLDFYGHMSRFFGIKFGDFRGLYDFFVDGNQKEILNRTSGLIRYLKCLRDREPMEYFLTPEERKQGLEFEESLKSGCAYNLI